MEDLEEKDDFYCKFNRNLLNEIGHITDHDRFNNIKFEINSRLDESDCFASNFGFAEKIIDDVDHAAFGEKMHAKAEIDLSRSVYLSNHPESENRYQDAMADRKRKKDSGRYMQSDSIKDNSNNDDSSYKSTKRVRINSENEVVKLVGDKSDLINTCKRHHLIFSRQAETRFIRKLIV